MQSILNEKALIKIIYPLYRINLKEKKETFNLSMQALISGKKSNKCINRNSNCKKE